eukprot:TRINITY_DN22504_c0_g1_i1.p1 TRINITY_DN22504_c0_g1~~TRINITY_DN22504_c0_g1_i1.p1  ORF type:complete len:824 (+),score=71.51 TRINITY_DN22504_c0_g1_i1:150-2474(+)
MNKLPKRVLRTLSKTGQTALHIGIQLEASAAKLVRLIDAAPDLASVPFRDQIPLHMCFRSEWRDDAEVINKLIDAWPQGVHLPDLDGRSTLQIILDQRPFPAAFTELAFRVSKLAPQQVSTIFKNGNTPLMTCLQHSLPPRLTIHILLQARWTASVPREDGLYPLHVAIALDMDLRMLTRLIEAYPNALIKPMHHGGVGPCVPIDYAIRTKSPTAALNALLLSTPGTTSTAMMQAYARAAACGQFTFRKLNAAGAPTKDAKPASSSPLTLQKPGMMSLQVRDELLHETVDIVIDKDALVDDLKIEVEHKTGLPVELQCLTLDGQELLKGTSLQKSGISFGATVILKERFELFHTALRHSVSEDVLLLLLRLNPGVAFAEDQHGWLPLHLALKFTNSYEVVNKLLKLNPNAINEEMYGLGSGAEYALQLAVRNKFPPTVIQTMLTNTNSNDWTPDGRYNPNRLDLSRLPLTNKLPLHLAIDCGCTETVHMLLESKCPILPRCPTTKRTALECTLCSNQEEDMYSLILRVTVALDEGVLARETKNGQTPLHIAVMNHASVTIVQSMCELYMPALDVPDIHGRLPLHVAVLYGADRDLVRLLVRLSPSSVIKTDELDRIPVQIAVVSKAKPGVVQELIWVEQRSSKRRDRAGLSLLQLALRADAPEWIIQELMDSAPHLVDGISLLSKEWPTTEAASYLARVLQTRRNGARQAQRELIDEPCPPAAAVTAGYPNEVATRSIQLTPEIQASGENTADATDSSAEDSLYRSLGLHYLFG